jgi:hypothetical protein
LDTSRSNPLRIGLPPTLTCKFFIDSITRPTKEMLDTAN